MSEERQDQAAGARRHRHASHPPTARRHPPRQPSSRRQAPPAGPAPGRRPRRSLARPLARAQSRLAKFGYVSATVLTALAVLVSLTGYGIYLKLDHNISGDERRGTDRPFRRTACRTS